MNLVQEKITKILEDGGMNDKHKKRELIEILKKACPKTENSKNLQKENLKNLQKENLKTG
ncbi:26224_t:CDS:1, partial [Dentiscutata erythropus]